MRICAVPVRNWNQWIIIKSYDMCARKKKMMIYDHDKWLKPYKDVIDRRHEMILGLKERMSVDGSLSC